MILVYAIAIGIVAAWLRAKIGGASLTLPAMRGEWLIMVAIIPQLLVFFLPGTQRMASREVASAVLVVSQFLLLLFVWWNRDLSGFWLLGLGLLLNFLVITINGGLMPISPETVHQLAPDIPIDHFEIGQRMGGSKDILLNENQTRLALLSDQFTFPAWFPARVAFSLGDILIALGIIWFFWQGCIQPPLEKETSR